jgi:hypothetical protein
MVEPEIWAIGCLRTKASASASASASDKNCFFWSHVKKRPLALALALVKAREKGPLALALPSLAVTQNKRLFWGCVDLAGCHLYNRKSVV